MAPLRALVKRLRVPKAHAELGELVVRHHGQALRARELRPSRLLDLLTRLDALRRPQRLEDFLLACQADYQGRPGFEDRPYAPATYLRGALAAAQAIQGRDLAAEGYRGATLGEELRRRRLAALAAFRRSQEEDQ